MHAMISWPMAVDVFDSDPHQYDVCCGSSHINYVSTYKTCLESTSAVLAHILPVASLRVVCSFIFNYVLV